MKTIVQYLKNNWLVILIFTGIFFMRLWNVPELFFFGIDEEYQSLLAVSIVKDFHLIWIGLSAANTGYYVGPGLVYVHALLLWLSRLDPVILGYTASITSSLFAIALYGGVKSFFNKKIAIISTIIYGFSSFVILYDRRFWNSSFVPFAVFLFFLSYVLARKNSRWYIATAILIGLSFHIHASMFIFLPITATVLFFHWKSKTLKLDFLSYFISFILYFLITLPLAIYDKVHNFDNIKTPIRMLTQLGKGQGSSFSITQHIEMMIRTISQFIGISGQFSILIFIVCIGVLVWFFLKKKNITETIIMIIVCWYGILFLLFPGKILDYYYIGFFPFFSIILGIFISKFNTRILIFSAILFISIQAASILQLSEDSGLLAKQRFIQKTINSINNRSFYLDTNQEYLYFGGWRYLFEAYGQKPVMSQADAMFGWIYQKEITPNPELKVTISQNPLELTDALLEVISSYPYYATITKYK